MKRLLGFSLTLALLGGVVPRTRAEDAATTLAYRQDLEDRYKRLNAAVEDVQATQALLQRKLSALTQELQALREDRAQTVGTYAKASDLSLLANRLAELERKREEDKKLILEEIRKLAQTPVVTPPVPAPEPAPPKAIPPPASEATGVQRGYTYEIKPRDTLDAIVAAYRQHGIKVTLEQVLQANPKLDPRHLKVGQKVWIPTGAQP